MDDDQLRHELERRSQAAAFRAEELLPEVRRWTEGGVARPARFARWAPLAGLAGAAIIVLALIIAWPRSEAGPSSSSTPRTSMIANAATSSPALATPTPAPSTPTAAPSIPEATRIQCLPGPIGRGVTPEPRELPVIIDETGLVEACGETDVEMPATGDITVSNPFELTDLEVVLRGRPCIDYRTLTFRRNGEGYDLIGTVACSDNIAVGGGSFHLILRAPVDASAVNAYTTDQTPTSSVSTATPKSGS